jgi:hypothetical protein
MKKKIFTILMLFSQIAVFGQFIVEATGPRAMRLRTSGLDRVHIGQAGNVGVGTNSPDFNLEVIGDSDAGFSVTRYGGDSPGIFGRSAGGTITTPTATLNGHILSLFGGRGHNGTTFSTGKAKIEMVSTELWTSTANGTNMSFFTTPNGTSAPVSRVFIGNSGNVGIGTGSPDAKLDIDGDIILGVKSHEPLFPNSNIIALDREGKSVIRITGTNTTSLSGIAGGVDGMLLYIYNYDSVNFTISHNNGTALNENRIWTGNGSDIVFTSRGGAILVYDGVNLKWRVLSYND